MKFKPPIGEQELLTFIDQLQTVDSEQGKQIYKIAIRLKLLELEIEKLQKWQRLKLLELEIEKLQKWQEGHTNG